MKFHTYIKEYRRRYFKDADKLVEISTGLKSAMKGLEMSEIPEGERLQERGW